MHKQLRELERQFKPGYKLVDVGVVGAHVEGPDGRRIEVDGKVLAIAVSDSSMHRDRRAHALLVQAGVIAPARRRRAHEEHVPRPPLVQPKAPLVLASETMRDRHASPRERSLARELLAADQRHQALRKLTRRLGGRLRELEAILDAQSADAA